MILLALLATNVAALAAALHYRASRDVWRARALDAMGSGRAANRSPASVRADAPAGRAMNHYSSSGSLLDLSHFRPNTQRDMAPPPAPAVVQRPAKRAMPSFDVVADAEASIKGRLPLIRMLLPAKVAEIMALYPDIWPGPNNSTGYRRLVADLHRAGAVPGVRERGVWALAPDAPAGRPSQRGKWRRGLRWHGPVLPRRGTPARELIDATASKAGQRIPGLRGAP